MGDGRSEMGDARWEMGDGRWEMEKRRRLVAVLVTVQVQNIGNIFGSIHR
jgi:hypothetical protein